MTRDIATFWKRLEAWGSRHAPDMLKQLSGPASINDILAVEAALGVAIPAELRASLLIHDGEKDAWPSAVWGGGGALLSCDRIIEQWTLGRDLDAKMDHGDEPDPAELIAQGIISVKGAVKPLHFSPRWIPIMSCNGDILWYADMDPAKGGVEGQIIEVDLECCSWKVVAPSFGHLLEQYVMALEQGAFAIDENGLPQKLQA